MIIRFKVPLVKQKFSINLVKTPLYLFMIILVAFTSLPLIYVISTAFKPLDELLKFPPQFLVRRPTIENFTVLITALSSSVVPFSRYAFNSLFVTSATVAATIFVSSLGAFAMTKHNVLFGKTIFIIITIALVFPVSVTQIPNYLIVKELGIINSYWALIIPKIAVAYNMFLMKQFCQQLPNVFLEAARIDGASEMKIFWKIVMPFLKPAWSTLAVFSFVASWNDYFTPLIMITKNELKTLPLALTMIADTGSLARAGAAAATSFIMILPTLIVFTAMQKQVVEAVTYSGIK
jgi:ABC-type glycerol-3-phosphate transport system permease component